VYKRLKQLGFISGFVAITLAIARPEAPILDPQRVDNFTFVENQLLQSSRYTQPDFYESSMVEQFFSQYQLSYSTQDLIDLGFVYVIEDEISKVYFEPWSYSVLIKDKASEYFYSSRPEFQGFSETREDNTSNRNQMNSGLWIESIRTNNIASSSIQVESLYTLADVSYQNNGAQDLDNIDLTKPYVLEAGSYDTDAVNVSVEQVSNVSLSTQIAIEKYGFEFSVNLALNNGKFQVQFSPESIRESNPTYRLMALQFFPYLGSVRENVYPGYFVIPDGVGALVRTDKRLDTSFQADYYGSDLGYLKTSVAELTLPIYGIIHAVDAYGLMAEITEGSEHSTLLAQFWGRSTRYHRMTNRFNIRRIYRNIINRAGDGNDVIPEEVINQDFEVQYQTLQGQDASYIGVAKQYQASLAEKDVLIQKTFDKTPLQTSYLVAEQEPNVFGTSRVQMTTYDEAIEIYDDLKTKGITSHVSTLMGWSEDGLTYVAPYRTNYIDKSGLKEFVSLMKEDGNSIYLDQEYLVSSERSKRINYNNDVSRNYSKLKMDYTIGRLDNQNTDLYYLYPTKSYEKMSLDQRSIQAIGVDGLSMPRFGNTLSSFYNGERQSRTNTLTILEEAKALYEGYALHRPNAYMFDRLNAYLDMPITNSQFDLYSDLVPLIPVVLKGYIPMFTPYLNFNALGIERLLQMVDFGINPSYLLTHEKSSELRFTLSNRFYTTQYDDFAEDIEATYAFVSEALDFVLDASINDRVMLDVGVSKVTYSNGVSIIVNYRQTEFVFENLSVSPLSYEVLSV
jgi:hypothetical protein